MFTPAISSEIWKSYCVTWRAQPPFWMRRGALLKDAQNSGRSPTSVAGGRESAGKLVLKGRVVGTWIADARGVALRVDRALRRLIRISEGRCTRGRDRRCHATGGRRGEKAATGWDEVFHRACLLIDVASVCQQRQSSTSASA